jgi:glycosyltransferase involved in cell wall biosynthesis
VKVTFVYAQSRRALVEQVAAGTAPDSQLLGQSRLGELGIEAGIHEPRLTRRQWRSRAGHWLAWYGRELLLPWEMPRSDAVVTTLPRLFPLASRLRGRPLYVMNQGLCNENDRSSRPRRAAQTAVLRAAAGIVCFALAHRERLLQQTGLHPERVHVATLGVDEAFWTPRDGPVEDYVIAVGFDPGRDYATLAEAMRGLPYRTVIVARPRNLVGVPLPENSELQGDASFLELRDLYARARCVIVPTRREGYPYGGDTTGLTTLLEAMAMAKPIVISEHGWLSDYVVDGHSARLVPAEDAARLREAIERLCEDRPLAESMGRAARAAIEERLTTRHLAERLASILRADAPA